MLATADTDFLIRLAIREHCDHPKTKEWLNAYLDSGCTLAIAPQVISEFIHVSTDSRRFAEPLTIDGALQIAQIWADSEEVTMIYPSKETFPIFHRLMTTHRLGRKRVLDTLLAATCLSNGITHIITANEKDYRIFENLSVISFLESEK